MNKLYTIPEQAIVLGGTNILDFTLAPVLEGWYDNPALSGPAVTAVTTGSVGDKDFYARWVAAGVPSLLSLDESLTWLSDNAIDGGQYAITQAEDEALAPRTLAYSGKTVGITLNGGALVMNTGATLTGNSTSSDGGGVGVDGNGTLDSSVTGSAGGWE